MIRILHMIGSLEMGGSQALVMNLYRHMDHSRIQFDFVIDHPERKSDYFAEIENLGGIIYKMPSFHGNVHQVRKAWDGFFSNHPEYKVLHSHVRSYASLYLPVAKKHGVKTIIHSHSTSNGNGFSSVVKMTLQYPLRYQADVLMGCSKESGEWLFGKKACHSDKFFLMPNAVDLERFAYDENTRSQYRRELGLDNKLVVGHVGRFHQAKNHMFLLQAFAQLKKLRPDAALLLVGDGELRGDIEAKTTELGIADDVMLTGNRKDVAELMQAMDVLAFPSLWEGLPVTVVEAQAVGLPCLISDKITHAVDLSPLVQRLPIEEPASWAAALCKPMSRLDVREDIIASGFEINSAVSKLTQLYESLYDQAN